MVFKKQDNLQKIRYEIIRERIIRKHIIIKAVLGGIDIAIGVALLLFDINFVIFVWRFTQYIAFSWESAAITIGALTVSLAIFIIGITFIAVGVEVFAKGAKLDEQYKKDYGIEVL